MGCTLSSNDGQNSATKRNLRDNEEAKEAMRREREVEKEGMKKKRKGHECNDEKDVALVAKAMKA